jgi:hypothetical protein
MALSCHYGISVPINPQSGAEKVMKNIHRPKRLIAYLLWCVAVMTLDSGAYANPWGDFDHERFEGLTGTWRVQVTIYNCKTGVASAPFSSFLTFDASGTLTGTTANAAFLAGQRSPDHGVWRRLGGNYFTATSEAFIQFSTPATSPTPPLVRGSQRIEQGIQLTGPDSFHSDATLTFFDEGGSVVLSGCATASGRRFH